MTEHFESFLTAAIPELTLPETLSALAITYEKGIARVFLDTAPLRLALAELPALPVCRSKVGTLEPFSRPADVLDLICPVRLTASEAKWFTKAAVPEEVVEVILPLCSPAWDQFPGYVWAPSGEGTREWRWPSLSSFSPQELEDKAWNAFYEAERYTQGHRRFAQVIQAAVLRGVEVALLDLPPAPHPCANLSAPQNSPVRGLFGSNEFWTLFSPEQVSRLLDFANNRVSDAEAQDKHYWNTTLNAARSSLELLFDSLPSGQKNEPSIPALSYYVQLTIGAKVSVQLTSRTEAVDAPTVEYALTLGDGRNAITAFVHVRKGYSKEGMDWEFPSYVLLERRAARRL